MQRNAKSEITIKSLQLDPERLEAAIARLESIHGGKAEEAALASARRIEACVPIDVEFASKRLSALGLPPMPSAEPLEALAYLKSVASGREYGAAEMHDAYNQLYHDMAVAARYGQILREIRARKRAGGKAG